MSTEKVCEICGQPIANWNDLCQSRDTYALMHKRCFDGAVQLVEESTYIVMLHERGSISSRLSKNCHAAYETAYKRVDEHGERNGTCSVSLVAKDWQASYILNYDPLTDGWPQ